LVSSPTCATKVTNRGQLLVNFKSKRQEMEHKVNTEWKDGLTFESDVVGFKILMDAKPEVGGRNLGPNPKPVLHPSIF
jgi:hypothetical protein